MKNLLIRILGRLVDLEHILTPFAVEHLKTSYGAGTFKTFKLYYIFGIRVANISTLTRN